MSYPHKSIITFSAAFSESLDSKREKQIAGSLHMREWGARTREFINMAVARRQPPRSHALRVIKILPLVRVDGAQTGFSFSRVSEKHSF